MANVLLDKKTGYTMLYYICYVQQSIFVLKC